jgi:hypothetical protein
MSWWSNRFGGGFWPVHAIRVNAGGDFGRGAKLRGPSDLAGEQLAGQALRGRGAFIVLAWVAGACCALG